MPNCLRPPHFPPHCGCPAGAITRSFTSVVKKIDAEEVDIPLATTLSYDSDKDPYAVQATFRVGPETDRDWFFSRDLLSAGVYSHIPLGQGDIKFRTFHLQGIVLMCLRSRPDNEGGAQHADIALPRREVIDF